MRAYEVLQSVDAVVGYSTYIDLIHSLIKGKTVISTAMTKEVERVQAAMDVCASGKSCALVSGGDPGIYAMAGLVFEMCQKKNIRILPPHTDSSGADVNTLCIEVVPGIPALCAGASLLGAPIGHDFAVISLSDLLTPWETIESRIEAAATADFVIIIYNPKSRKRHWQLEKAQQIILKHRHPDTPAGIVTSAMREKQHAQIVRLQHLNTASVDMQSIIFIGNSSSQQYLDYIVTPRGYSGKYTRSFE